MCYERFKYTSASLEISRYYTQVCRLPICINVSKLKGILNAHNTVSDTFTHTRAGARTHAIINDHYKIARCKAYSKKRLHNHMITL